MDDPTRLIDWLAERDEPCPVCGYSLRGITEPACPECNARIELSVRSPDRLVGPWAMMLIAAALALGFDGVVALLGSIPLLIAQTLPPPPVALLYLFFVVASALLTLTIIMLSERRTRIQRLPRRTQWTIAWSMAVGIFLLHAAVGGWFLWVMN